LTTWHKFDYEDKAKTAPPITDPVWVVEEFYTEGVTLGWFDGYTFQTFDDGDDCKVSYWAYINYPEPPKEWNQISG
jgi:hypothetical protein